MFHILLIEFIIEWCIVELNHRDETCYYNFTKDKYDKNIIKSHSFVSSQLCKTRETKSFETFVSKLELQYMFYYHKHDYFNYYVNLMWYKFCPQIDTRRCLFFGLYDMCKYIPLNLGLTKLYNIISYRKIQMFPFWMLLFYYSHI